MDVPLGHQSIVVGVDEVDEDDGERALLHEELSEDGKNWARSDDVGCFYPD